MSEPQPNQTPIFHRFADWCLHKDSLSSEAKHTVERLLYKARTRDCYEAEQKLASLTRLNLKSEEICDLSPLSILSDLTYLKLGSNQISDLSPLSQLTNLNYLELDNNQISDISPLSGLTNLTQLVISDNKISLDLSPISTLINLTKLDLSYTRVSNFNPLSNLTQLNELYLDFNCFRDGLISEIIFDLSPLSGLTNLTQLNIGDYGISDLSPLSELVNLRKLYLGNNRISDLSPLSKLINLTNLNIRDNLLSDFSPISELTNLEALKLGTNQISDLSHLSRLHNLTYLSLGNNNISNLSPLAGLTNLRQLDLGKNPISDISPLFELTNLDSLTTHGSRLITDNIWLSSIRQKWFLHFTVPTNQHKAAEAIKSIYTVLDLEEPEVIYCPDPYEGQKLLYEFDEFNSIEKPRLGESLAIEFSETCHFIGTKLSLGLCEILNEEIGNSLPILEEVNINLYPESDYITSNQLLQIISLAQLLVSKFNYVLDQKEQEALECLNQLFENCGWIFPYEKVCIVCDRPRKISLDTEDCLHAEGEPAIQFSDGWHTGYYYHGVELPEKYGKVHPHQWQAEWLLAEENAELRRVLIQAIGYDRICEQLKAQVIDSWQEYSLLRIDADVDVEPIHLLKMTCPSTAKIHTLRVPPEINSARVAIRWVNWDIDPEDFSVQT